MSTATQSRLSQRGKRILAIADAIANVLIESGPTPARDIYAPFAGVTNPNDYADAINALAAAGLLASYDHVYHWRG